jgi:hypothetical protein
VVRWDWSLIQSQSPNYAPWSQPVAPVTHRVICREAARHPASVILPAAARHNAIALHRVTEHLLDAACHIQAVVHLVAGPHRPAAVQLSAVHRSAVVLHPARVAQPAAAHGRVPKLLVALYHRCLGPAMLSYFRLPGARKRTFQDSLDYKFCTCSPALAPSRAFSLCIQFYNRFFPITPKRGAFPTRSTML